MSYRSAAERTGLTARNIRTAVTTLVNFGMVEKSTQQTTQQATVLTICNYDLYQFENSETDTANDTAATQQRHSSDTAATLDKKDKELIKKVKKKNGAFSEAFERWWKTYPKRKGRKIGKKAASKMFVKINKADWQQLKLATENYAKECNGLPKDAERFLRNDFWKEYLGTPQGGSKTEPSENRMSREELEAFLLEGIAATADQEELENWLKPRDLRCWRIACRHIPFLHENGKRDFNLFWSRYTDDE